MEKKENNLGGFVDFTADGFRDEFLLDQLVEVDSGGNALHDFDHLGADFERLSGLGVGSLAGLANALLGEANAEHADEVTVQHTIIIS